MNYQQNKNNRKKPKSSSAKALKIISFIICFVFFRAGIAIGAIVAPDNDTRLIAMFIGAIVGLVIGIIVTIIIRYLAELSNNAKATTNAYKVSGTDQIMMYKELLDNGAITEEEFNKKKKELLNL